MVDFAALRNQILFGEGDESGREPSTLEKEAFDPTTGIPLFIGAATVAFCAADKAKFDVLGDHRPLAFILLGVAPLAYGLGRLSRGTTAHAEVGRYEHLLEATQRVYEAELEKRDGDGHEAEENLPQTGYLAEDAQYFFEPVANAEHVDFGSHGIYGAAVGQEQFAFEPAAEMFAPRVSYEAETFGW